MSKLATKLKKFKEWAYTVPPCDSPVWDELDLHVDKGLETAFGNNVTVSIFKKVDRFIEIVEEKATKAYNFIRLINYTSK